MEVIAVNNKNTTSKELINLTHRQNSPWRIAAEKNGVYEKLNNGKITNTDFILDMSELVRHDEWKNGLYQLYIEEH